MAKKPETQFRTGKVAPFLRSLANTAFFPIQQLAIHGDADYILCSRGHFVWLELKDDGESPRPLQEYKANWVQKTGGTVIIASPSNWAACKRKLLSLDRGDFPE